MKPRKPTAAEVTAPGGRAATDQVPALPAWKAFVVQFSRESETAAGVITGRVEHLASGQRAQFGMVDELMAVLVTMLDGVAEGSYKRWSPR